MSMLRTWSEATEAPRASVPRRLTAGALKAASAVLTRIAERLETPPTRHVHATAVTAAIYPAALQAGEPHAYGGERALARLEFHAEPGERDGAIYVDGKLVGWLPGVTRL